METRYLDAIRREFVISGFSMVRRANSIHWFLVGGQVFTDDEWKLRCSEDVEVDLGSIEPGKRAFLKTSLDDHDYKAGAPLPLDGTETAQRTIIAGEIDLKSGGNAQQALHSAPAQLQLAGSEV